MTRRITWSAVALTLAVGCVALAGWMLQIPILQSLYPGGATMKINTALCFLLAALALGLLAVRDAAWRRWLSRTMAALVGLIGLLTLSEYLVGWNLGLDQLLASDPARGVGQAYPGRMAPITALNFILASLALLLLGSRRRQLTNASHLCALTIIALSYLALAGYVLDASAFFRWRNMTIAFPTVIAFVLLAVGILCARPASVVMDALGSEGPGGVLTRRLLPALLTLPIVLACLILEGGQAGLYDAPVGAALLALSVILLFSLLTWWMARRLDQLDARRRQSEAEYRELFESAADGRVQADPASGRFLRVNRRFCEITGYPCEELLAMSFAQLSLPEDRQADETLYQRHVRGEIPAAMQERRFRRKDGQVIWVQVHMNLLRDAAGRPLYAIGGLQDISERKRIERELRQSEEFSRCVLNSMPAHVAVLDRHGTIVQANEEWKRFARENGAPEPDRAYLGDNYLEICRRAAGSGLPGREGAQECLEKLQALMDAMDGVTPQFDLEYPCHSPQEERWFMLRAAPVFGGEGRVVISHINITELKRAEEAVRRSEAIYRAVARNIPDGGVFVVGHDLRHLIAEGSIVARFERTREELEGRTLKEVLNDPALPVVEEHYRRALAGETASYETERQGRVYLSHHVPLRDENGRVLAAMALVLDITQRKAAERQLAEQAEALQEADRRKDEFLAMLAHELRNPLAPVRNAVQILKLSGANEAVREKNREIIERQVTHMARLLDDLLDITRVTRGTIGLKKEPVQLPDVIARAVEAARPLIEARHHTLTVTSSPTTPQVLGDLDRLIQIVGNLLNNAAKYTDEGGTIGLSVAREGEQAVIRVRDTGMGIAPEMLSKVFDVFTQAERTLESSQKGLGLGLALVKNLVQMHGGGVEAHSAGLGQGSEFIVRLPALLVGQAPGRHSL